MEERQSLQQIVLGIFDSHMQKNETGPFPYTIHKDKLQWIKDLDVRQESIKILEENIGHSNLVHDTSPEPTETIDKMNLLDFIKIKSSAQPRTRSKKIKRQPTAHRMGEFICK